MKSSDGKLLEMEMGNQLVNHSFKVGQKIMCNGYSAKITKICEGQLEGMAEVRVPGGITCVGITELKMQNPEISHTGMNTEQKIKLITAIISHLKFSAKEQKKEFDEGDTYFALCFKSDSELQNIAKLAGV